MRVWIISGRKVAKGMALCFTIMLLIGAGFTTWALSGKEKELPIYSVEIQEKKITLGINCAWDDPQIEEILDILDQYHAKATFFVVGEWCDKYPQLVKMIHERGHEVGNHSNHHPDMTKMSKEEIAADIEQAGAKIEQLTGTRPTVFRAPSGAYNDTVLETARELGYEVIQWDVDSIDWKNPDAQTIVSRVTSKVNPGSICLFHAGKENTLQALPQILEQLSDQGYSFVPAGELVYSMPYEIDRNGRQHSLQTESCS